MFWAVYDASPQVVGGKAGGGGGGGGWCVYDTRGGVLKHA